MTDIEAACRTVEGLLRDDPTAALNEAELQALLQDALLSQSGEFVPATLGTGVIRRDHHPELLVQRVFRELKPDGGRAGKEADLLVLESRPQVVEAKQNGAPARFKGPFEAIVETQIDNSAHGLLAGRRCRPRAQDLLVDLAKWRAYVETGLVKRVVAVVLTTDPDAYAGLDDVIAIEHDLTRATPWQAEAPVDPWPSIDKALTDVADHYRRHPVGCIREKDFETRIFTALRAKRLPRAQLAAGLNRALAVDPVRAQWSGPWATVLGRGRRHDLVALDPGGDRLLAELELKTSHSDSHNWFRKREVEGELQAMQQLVEQGLLARGRFVMFRYGRPLWQADAERLFARFPHVEFAYHAA